MEPSGDLIGAVGSGDRGAALRALRDLLAREIVSCELARDVAALSGRLTDVLTQIDGLPGAEEATTPLDDLAARRSGRGATAPRQSRTSRR